jgi:hypothetical protein
MLLNSKINLIYTGWVYSSLFFFGDTTMRKMLALLLLLLIGWSLHAQEATPESTSEAERGVPLRTFTLEIGDLSGAAPADWTELQAGAYLRNEDEADQSYILHVSAEGVAVAELIEPFVAAYELESLPESRESYEASLLTWTIYSFDYSPTDMDLLLRVDMAVAEDESRVYVVLLQTFPQDNELLRSQIFFPALDYFGLPLATIQEALGYEALEPVTLTSFGIESAYPISWQEVKTGSYMRGRSDEDLTTLIIQSSPDLEAVAFAQLLLETIGLPPELPEEVEVYEGDDLSWSLYSIDYEDYRLLIASAEDGQLSYLVVLLGLTEEIENLRNGVLLPVLDVTKPID